MAKILADEHFPVRIQDRLRRLGHDVTTVRQYDENKSGDGKSDEEVLRIATAEGRAVLTMNKKDFKALHEARVIGAHYCLRRIGSFAHRASETDSRRDQRTTASHSSPRSAVPRDPAARTKETAVKAAA